MILLSSKSRITCDALGCTTAVDGQLALMATGGFAVKPPTGWQVTVSPHNPGGVLGARCPLHHADAQRIITEEAH